MKNADVPIKILVADDHPLIRDSFRMCFKNISGYNLIGEADDGIELIKLAKELQPDIIITDILMPVMNGIDATKQILKDQPLIGIIALSMVDEGSLIEEMIEAGARGYLLKNSHIDEILFAIQQVYKGQTYHCKESTTKLAEKVSEDNKRKKMKPVFTEQEILIIKLVCQGLSSKEIGKQLSLSKRTIEWHRLQILEKLDSHNSAAIIAYGIKNHIY